MLKPFRSFLFPLFQVGDGLLPPDPPTVDPPAPPRSRHNVTCEFCNCILTPTGDALKISDEAKAFRAQGDTISRLRDELREAQEQVTQLERHKAELTADLEAERKATKSLFRR